MMTTTQTPSRAAAVLSRTDEVALARRIERGDLKAKETMIESNLRLVHAVAKSFHGSAVSYADLIQEGTLGLVRAVELFDHRRGVKFATYARWWIRRSMRDAIADAKVIRIPPKPGRQLAAVRRAEAELERFGRRRPSDAEIADRTDLGVTTVRSLRTAAQVTASLDAPVIESTTPLGDLIPDPTAVDPAERVIADERRNDVSAMLRLLPPRHREVLVRRYGLNGSRVQSHSQIGGRLGIGEDRSRQVEREALHRLRSMSATSALAA
jgi:RNA polymerase primary sigma factor